MGSRRMVLGTGGLVLAGVVAVALNLRTTLTVVGPLVPTIRADLAVDNVAMGAVGTLPVLAFGLVAPFAAPLARRVGIAPVLAAAMGLLALGTLVRSAGGYPVLLAGTAVLGVAIAVCNVLLPALVKEHFPTRAGTVTSLYVSLMIVGATISAGIAVPLQRAVGWRASLAVWALPALVAAVVVLVSDRADRSGRDADEVAAGAVARRAGVGVPAALLHRSPLAWQVTAFMGLQSVLFYVTLAWLPDVLVERGMDDAAAGVVVAVLNIGGLVGSLAFPALAARHDDQRWWGAGSGLATVVGLALLLVPGTALALPAAAVFGVGAGGTISLALLFFGLRTTTPTEAAALSGMAQTWGYVVSAFGPVAWGALRDASGSWDGPLALLVAVAVATTIAGWAAGRDRTLDLTGRAGS